jgi:hypothetical protein
MKEEGSWAQKICQWVQDLLFWYNIQTLAMILELVYEAQRKSESDRLNMGHTINSWKLLKAVWHEASSNPEWHRVK